MLGCAPTAACQLTVWPLAPESAAVNFSGAVRRYTPSASWTTMSPDIVLTMERTSVWAADSGQGCAVVQAVPVPDGEA